MIARYLVSRTVLDCQVQVACQITFMLCILRFISQTYKKNLNHNILIVISYKNAYILNALLAVKLTDTTAFNVILFPTLNIL